MKREIENLEEPRKKDIQPATIINEAEEISDEESSDPESIMDQECEYDEEGEEQEGISEQMQDLKVYLPGVQLENDEILTVDKSTYLLLHHMNIEWPCLSFDVLHDKYGQNRTKFPLSCYLAAGSQAPTGENKVLSE